MLLENKMVEKTLSRNYELPDNVQVSSTSNSTYIQLILGYADPTFRRKKANRAIVFIGPISDLISDKIEGLLERKVFSFENQTTEQVLGMFNSRMDELCLAPCISENDGITHKLVYGSKFYKAFKNLVSNMANSRSI